jgi:predicted O-methyltransferase YrrM
MNLQRAQSIFGWMTDEEMEWLAFEGSRHKVIVEIGSYVGRSARAIADNTDGILYCVDHWNGPIEFDPPHERESLYGHFCANTGDLIEQGRVVPVQLSSVEAAEKWFVSNLTQPDMVFIDGSHDYENFRKDLFAWAKVIKPGGLFCGHDSHWPGVEEGRRLHLPPHMTGVGGIWAVDNFSGLRE